MAGWRAGMAVAFLFSVAASVLRAQTIRVDITPSHATNTFKPTEALGAGIDRLPYGAADKIFVDDTIKQILSAGWQTVTYRQNTELHIESWHWNPNGTWSDPAGKGYFVGNGTPGADMVRHSYGYPLPHRGVTRDDGTDQVGFSRLDDGDETTYWKSNPYLTRFYTGEDDAAHPQWVFFDLSSKQDVTAIRIAWAEPYATKYAVQYWTGDDPIHKPAQGSWQAFPGGVVTDGKGGNAVLQLSTAPISVQWVRVWMTASSNTCDTHGSADKRDCMGYAIREIYLGTTTKDGKFHDLLRHTPDQDQTATYCSSVDPWHEPSNLAERAGDQIGFDLFFTSGVTRGLPAMIPIAMLYNTPEDAAAEISYIEKRGYPISYVEMGEEPDGHYTLPEDYGALYIQFAEALHRVDPKLKLGGPIFTGENKDIEVWPDQDGKASFTGRFIDYLKARGKIAELAFFSFEHYPVDPGKVQWSNLYDEAYLVQHIMDVWRQDGVPANVPFFITESNLCSASSEAFMDIWGGLWLADYIGAFLSGGGSAVYYFHYMPEPMGRGFNSSPGTFGFFSADRDFRIKQPLAQFFVSQLLNLEWVKPGDGEHKVFTAVSNVSDGAGHQLVTAYAVKRPDEEYSLLIVNKDQENEHAVNISFEDEQKKAAATFNGTVHVTTFGKAQYRWHPELEGGKADPDGPAAKSTVNAGPATSFVLPAASVTVIRGTLGGTKPAGK